MFKTDFIFYHISVLDKDLLPEALQSNLIYREYRRFNEEPLYCAVFTLRQPRTFSLYLHNLAPEDLTLLSLLGIAIEKHTARLYDDINEHSGYFILVDHRGTVTNA